MPNSHGGPNQRMCDAITIVEEAGVYEKIQEALVNKKKVAGRPCGLSVMALMVAMQFNAIGGKYFLSEVPGVLANLSPSVKRQLHLPVKSRGVSYSQVTRLYKAVVQLFRDEAALFEKDDPAAYAFFDEVMSAMATAGAHAKSKESPT